MRTRGSRERLRSCKPACFQATTRPRSAETAAHVGRGGDRPPRSPPLRFARAARAHHRDHRAGRLLPLRAAPAAPATTSSAWSARPSSSPGVTHGPRRSRRPRVAARGRARDRPRRALPPRGADVRPGVVEGPGGHPRARRRRDRDAPAGGARARRGRPRARRRAPARSSARRRSRRRTRTRRCARARPTASRSSRPTGSSTRSARSTGCTPAAPSPTTTSRRAAPSASSRARSRAGAAAIKLGLQDELVLGDLAAVRDWCHARDVVRGYRLMLQQDEPGDYVLAGGVGRTVGDLVDAAFGCVGLDPPQYVQVDARLVRPPERTPPVGDIVAGPRAPGLGARDELRGDDRGDGAGGPGGAALGLNAPGGEFPRAGAYG